MLLRPTISFVLIALPILALSQVQGPLQTFTSGGSITGSNHTSTSIPTHFSSFGQPFVIPRSTNNSSGAGLAMAAEIMFTAVDTQAPVVNSQSPATNSTGVPLNVTLSLIFSEAIARGTGDILIRNSSSTLIHTITPGHSSEVISGSTYTLAGLTFSANTSYHVIVPPGSVKDLAGNSFIGYSSASDWNFTTAAQTDTQSPVISTLFPADNSNGAATNSQLIITFNEAIKKGTGSILVRESGSNDVIWIVDVLTNASVSGNSLIITPGVLPSSTEIHVLIDATAIQDLAGNNFSGIGVSDTWNFTTGPSPDTTPPSVSSLSPVDEATDVSLTANILLNFNEPVQKGSGIISIRKLDDGNVVEDINVGGSNVALSGSVVTINPTANLPLNTPLFITVDGGAIKDLSSNFFLGISGNTTWNFTTVNDVTPPTLAGNSSSQTVTGNQSALINVTIGEDVSTITSVQMSHRTLGTTGAWPAATNLTQSGQAWTGTTTAALSRESGVEYRITATNTAGLSQTFGPFIIKLTIEGMIIPYTSFGKKQSNYRIVAVPLNVTANTVASIFEDDLGPRNNKNWRLARWSGNSTNQEYNGSIVPGHGYWLLVKEDPNESIDAPVGTTVQATSAANFEIVLTAGWNQIGNPYLFPIAWSDVEAANSTIGKVRVYDGSFSDGSRLKFAEGGFVFSQLGTVLKMPSIKTARVGNSPAIRNPIDNHDWEVYLNLSQGEMQNLISGVGMRAQASEDYDVFDGFSMPRFDEFLEVNHTRKINGYHYSKDIVPTQGQFIWEFSVSSSSKENEMFFSWDNTYFGKNDKQLVLFDVNSQRPIDMRLNQGYYFRRGYTNEFKVIFGDRAFVDEQTNVDRVVVHQVYPNPAAGDITVALALPADSWTSVELHDLFGRKVTTLFEGQLDKGHHDILCSRAGGNDVGLYLVMVKALGQAAVARVVLK